MQNGDFMSKKLCVLFALLACTLSGCSQVNTKIGMPWVYWDQGYLAVLGFLGVCVLVVATIVAFFDATNRNANDPEIDSAVNAGVILLVGGGFLLQALPYSESGIQFLPLPPWYYVSWTARIISIACWLATTLGFLFIFSKEDHANVALFGIIALVLNASLSFCSTSDVSSQSTTNSIASYPANADQWEERKQQQSELLHRLSDDKGMLETRIRNLGIRTKKELMKDPIAGPLVEELEELISQIAKVQTNIAAIESVQSKLRTLEREKAVGNATSTDDLTTVAQQLKVKILDKSDDQLPNSAMQRDRLLDGLIRPEGGK